MTSVPITKPYLLVVDDSPVVQAMLQAMLQPDYHVLVTGNPADVLKVVYEQPIAAILLDVTMPDMNGLDLCRTLRTIPQFQTLPVIIVTSKDAPFDKVQGRMAGANAYLTKPFDKDYLKRLIQQFIGKPLFGDSARS